ncbi:unnamed protein product [Sphagnum tenellum]
MDYWTKTTTYRPGWQSGDGQMSQVPGRFISGVRPGGSPLEVLALVAGFNGMVTWLGDLLEGNISAVDTLVYEDIEEDSSFVVVVSSSLDVPLWRSSGVLRQDANRLVSQAWREAFVHVEEEEVPQRTPISGPVGLSPLDTTPIAWEYPSEGICVLDLFGGISIGLAAVLQVGILVRKYLYVERDETTKRVSSHHFALLMRRYPELLSRSHVMANVHQIRSWIGPTVLLDVARVGSRAHRPRLWWTNLLPREVLRRAYETVPQSSHLMVDSILDIGRCSQVVKVVDRSPMAVVNRMGQPRMAFPTFVSFPASHAYREGGPRLV